jgi:hypothetical protein
MTGDGTNDGKVCQKDLGKDTAGIGAKMNAFDPGAGRNEAAH